ncbi:MAG: hypothetical protein ACON4K_00175 [Akkermansiaceae bacterium]
MRFLLFISLGLTLFSQAQESKAFEVKVVIHPVVQKLKDPRVAPELLTQPLAISTQSELASNHILAGIFHLNGPWDFEAYRHFTAAAKADPDCLMAYWGIAMSLGGLNHEFFSQRKEAVDRMLDLLEAGVGVEWEKGFAQAAGRLYANGAAAAAEVYGKLAEQYPNNLTAQIFALILDRDGYSESGYTNPGQKKAIEGLKTLVKANPENVGVISAWAITSGEAPLDSITLRDEILPYARKLARLHPAYPPFHMLVAHIASRGGVANLALDHARQAVKLYEEYCKREKVSVYDCPGIVRARVYLSTLLAGVDQFEEARKIANSLARTKIAETRVFSQGASALLWEGRSLGPRLALSKGTLDELEHGLSLLKVFKDEEWFDDEDLEKKKSLAVSYRNALAYCIGVRKALLKNDDPAINGLYRGLIERVKKIDTEMALARETSSYSEYLRARNTIEVFAVELRGMIAMRKEGAMKQAALSWFKSAADRQSRPLSLLPPSISYPMEIRIGEFYLATDEPEKAAKAFVEGNERMPNHLGSLRGYRAAVLKMGKNDLAKQIAERIEKVKGQ